MVDDRVNMVESGRNHWNQVEFGQKSWTNFLLIWQVLYFQISDQNLWGTVKTSIESSWTLSPGI